VGNRSARLIHTKGDSFDLVPLRGNVLGVPMRWCHRCGLVQRVSEGRSTP
jgi:hypothetical protein